MGKSRILPLCIAAFMIFTGCSAESTDAVLASDVSSTAGNAESGGIALADMFTDRDMEIGYDEETSARITLSGDGASCSSDAVSISGSTVTITDEGTYIFSGETLDGMITVDAGDTDKIQLVLDGVSITSGSSAAIYVKSADKVFITTASGSENYLANGGVYETIDENNIDAVIFSKSDLTLNGAGTLTISAAAGHGVVSKDDLVLTSGTYSITAASHGLSGKDSVRIASGTYDVVSGKDGAHAENKDDESLGFMYIAGGTFNITAGGDGLSAGSYLLVEDGSFTIEAGGGAAAAEVKSDMQGFSPEGTYGTADDETESTKGIKASESLTVDGGAFYIDSADDALHTNGSAVINSGDFEIATGDDGIHADENVTVAGGNISITESYEGIEGLSVDITAGEITIVSGDDGMNAAGGNDSSGVGGFGNDIFAVTEGAYINISGGVVNINASGDGIDSNGDLIVTDGEIYVSGPVDSGNSVLDYNGEGTISGGVFVGAGPSEMTQNFGDTSLQGVMMVSISSASAGSAVTLTDESGTQVLFSTPEKTYSCVIISCPEIVQGGTYTLSAGEYTTQISMESLVYGTGGMAGAPGGMGDMPGGMGEDPEGTGVTPGMMRQ